MGKFVDLAGQKFGRLTVIKRVKNNKNGKIQWLCKCDCGNEKIIVGNSLKSGLIKSCGCLRSESSKQKRGINIYNHATNKTILTIVSNKYGTKEFLIDVEDFEKIKLYHWGLRNYRNNFYAYTHIGNYKYLALHRLIADAPENMFVDHIDHNTLNNCRDNLKICTNKENQHNRAKLEGIKKTKWGFQVQMRVNGKLKCFGTYKTYEKAKEIRIKAEQECRPYVKEINKYGK